MISRVRSDKLELDAFTVKSHTHRARLSNDRDLTSIRLLLLVQMPLQL